MIFVTFLEFLNFSGNSSLTAFENISRLLPSVGVSWRRTASIRDWAEGWSGVQMVSNHGEIPLDRSHNLCYTEGEQESRERRALWGFQERLSAGAAHGPPDGSGAAWRATKPA